MLYLRFLINPIKFPILWLLFKHLKASSNINYNIILYDKYIKGKLFFCNNADYSKKCLKGCFLSSVIELRNKTFLSLYFLYRCFILLLEYISYYITLYLIEWNLFRKIEKKWIVILLFGARIDFFLPGTFLSMIKCFNSTKAINYRIQKGSPGLPKNPYEFY